jgi:LPXTG-site transpeptidase (sortase) family protein
MKNLWRSAKKWSAWAVPLALVAAGSSYLILAQETHASASVIVPPPAQTNAAATKPVKTPTHLSIPALSLDLRVTQGAFDTKNDQWNINDADAFFARGAATPLLYGHNRDGVFAPLAKAEKGTMLELSYPDGSSATYTYYGTRFVKPDDASVLSEKHDNMLILLTCSGFFSDSRRIVYFEAYHG